MRSIAFAGAVLLVGCSLLVDSSAVQCRTNQDCAIFDAAGPITCVNSVCVGPGAGPPCTTNMDCIARNNGAPAICRKDTMQCQPLLSTECAKVYGADPSDDNAIVIGSIFTLSGVNMPSGTARTQSAELAIDDFKNSVVGLPGGSGGKPRPLILVECDDGASNTQATTAATHLVQVGVPAIIGPGGSGLVTAVAQSVTIPAMTYLITPSATSITLSGLSQYVWRTAPSDALQAIAMQDQIGALAAAFTKANPTYTKIKLAMAYEDNTYGMGLNQDVTMGLNINGSAVGSAANMGYWFPLQYSSMTLDPSAAATSVEMNAANVVVGIGTNELATKFTAPIEMNWMTSVPRPYYLFSDAGQNPDLLTVVMASTNGLRTRIRGTVPGTTNALFNTFSTEYEGKYGGTTDVFGMAGAYDSVYIIAYAIVSVGTGQVNGTNIANAMGKIVGGTVSNVGASNIQSAFQALESGNSIQINGASGPLHFDLNAHEAPSDISVWCISVGGNGNPVYASSGRYYDSTMGAMTGTFACP